MAGRDSRDCLVHPSAKRSQVSASLHLSVLHTKQSIHCFQVEEDTEKKGGITAIRNPRCAKNCLGFTPFQDTVFNPSASGKRYFVTSENTGNCRLQSDSSPFGSSTQECLRGTCYSQLQTEASAGKSALLTFGSCTTLSQAGYSTGRKAKQGLLTSRFVSHEWILQHLRKHQLQRKLFLQLQHFCPVLFFILTLFSKLQLEAFLFGRCTNLV